MTYKTKVLLALMALGASFSVFVFFKSFNPSLLSLQNLKSSAFSIIDNDWDNDGLLNKEESYWNTDPNKSDTDGDGFLDGEEVASDHDPLKPAPDDKIVKNNLTKALSETALSGIAEGSLKPGNPNYIKSLNMVVDGVINQSQINLSPKKLSVNIVPDSYEAAKAYEEKIVPLLESAVDKEARSILRLVDLIDDTNFFDESKLNQQNKSFQNLRNFAYERAANLNRDVSVLETSPVPEILSEQHKFITKTFKSLALSYSYLANADSDPIQAMLSFQNIIFLFIEELPAKMTEYYSSMQKLKNNQ